MTTFLHSFKKHAHQITHLQGTLGKHTDAFRGTCQAPQRYLWDKAGIPFVPPKVRNGQQYSGRIPLRVKTQGYHQAYKRHIIKHRVHIYKARGDIPGQFTQSTLTYSSFLCCRTHHSRLQYSWVNYKLKQRQSEPLHNLY